MEPLIQPVFNLPTWDISGNFLIWDGNGDDLPVIDMGAYEYGSIGVGIVKPEAFSLQSSVLNYPNPFSDQRTFEYELKEPEEV